VCFRFPLAREITVVKHQPFEMTRGARQGTGLLVESQPSGPWKLGAERRKAPRTRHLASRQGPGRRIGSIQSVHVTARDPIEIICSHLIYGLLLVPRHGPVFQLPATHCKHLPLDLGACWLGLHPQQTPCIMAGRGHRDTLDGLHSAWHNMAENGRPRNGLFKGINGIKASFFCLM
jgi:hypothetical protein